MRWRVGVVGLGYVGLPVAAAFARKYPVVGFDINRQRIELLKKGIDTTGELSSDDLLGLNIDFTTDAMKLKDCNFIIVTVPTPIDHARRPDLSHLINASQMIAENMARGTIVVYESTVYPGTTEEILIPTLERYSGYKSGEDFYVGYSPERINPGDKEHTFTKIVKVVSGQDENTLSVIADLYGSVVEAGIYRAPSIKVAEAAKVIENTQRDLNIALMNELAIIFDRLGIDTSDVLAAASTKWNFLPFKPGLVGGHFIGVDPYYLTYKAESIGYHPQVILAGRRINDSMGSYIATSLVKQMILQNITIQGSCVTILGVTFKENVPDIRNSKVIDIVRELKEYGIDVQLNDPLASSVQIKDEYGLELKDLKELALADAVILAVPHREYVEKGWKLIVPLLKKNQKSVVVDVKSVLTREDCPEWIKLWRL